MQGPPKDFSQEGGGGESLEPNLFQELKTKFKKINRHLLRRYEHILLLFFHFLFLLFLILCFYCTNFSTLLIQIFLLEHQEKIREIREREFFPLMDPFFNIVSSSFQFCLLCLNFCSSIAAILKENFKIWNRNKHFIAIWQWVRTKGSIRERSGQNKNNSHSWP